MTIITGIALLAVLLCLGLLLLLNYIVVLSVRKMEEPEALLTVLDNGRSVLADGLEYADRARWAEDHGFTPDLVADFRGAIGNAIIVIGVWRNRATRTYLSSYTTPERVSCEFITLLENDSGLTTSNTRDAVMMPNAPGRYIQAFDGMQLDELYRRHEEGLAWLRQHKMLDPVEPPEATDALILEAVRRQMAHVKSLFLWQLRGAWWFFVRRHRLNNRSVAERYRN